MFSRDIENLLTIFAKTSILKVQYAALSECIFRQTGIYMPNAIQVFLRILC